MSTTIRSGAVDEQVPSRVLADIPLNTTAPARQVTDATAGIGAADKTPSGRDQTQADEGDPGSLLHEDEDEDADGEEEDYDEYDSEDAYSDSPPPRYVLRPGGPAAQRFYRIPEVRDRMLVFADQQSLGRMLRLEKDIQVPVAKELFRSVHSSVLAKMSRATPRRRIYCDAVRIIDRSPRPTLLSPENKFKPTSRERVKFDPEAVRKQITTSRKKCPNLTTIEYRYPSHLIDDNWTVHLEGDKIIVDLERHRQMDLHTPSLARDMNVNLFPAGPKYRGMEIRDTIGINLVCFDEDGYEHWKRRPKGLKRHLLAWKNWLYCNPRLDPRVVSIDHRLYFNKKNEGWEYRQPDYEASEWRTDPTFDEALAFLARRKQQNCSPMTHFYIPPSPPEEPVTAERFNQMVSLLNPEIRSLRVHRTALQNVGHTQNAIAAFDRACPNLGKLIIDHEPIKEERVPRSYVDSIPLSGLPHLRNFVTEMHREDAVVIGRYVIRMGSDWTIYQNLMLDLSCNRWFNDTVHDVKSSVLEGRTYRYGDGYVMYPEDEKHQKANPETYVESEWGGHYVTAC